MTILLISAGLAPKRGGGVPSYVAALIAELRKRGHKVLYLDTLCRSPNGEAVIVASPTDADSFSFFNSGARLPFNDGTMPSPRSDVRAGERALKIFLEFVKLQGPQVIHFQELLGIPGDIVRALRRAGWKTLFTAHDYYGLCPTIQLLRADTSLCSWSAAELQCDNCIRAWPLASRQYFTTWASPRVRGGRLRVWLGYRFIRHVGPILDRIAEAFWLNRSRYRWRRREMVHNLKAFDKIYCVSQKQQRLFSEIGGLSNVDYMHPSRPDYGTGPTPRRKSEDGTVRFLAINMNQKSKGIEVLIEEFTRLRRELPAAELHIYGAPASAIAGIHFHRAFAAGDFQRIIAEADIGVVPSIWEEAYGSVGPEMLTHGLPVIASRLGGIPEYVEDGVNGLLFDPRSPGDLARAMRRVGTDAVFLRGLRDKAAASTRGIVRFPAHVSQLEEAYRSTAAPQ